MMFHHLKPKPKQSNITVTHSRSPAALFPPPGSRNSLCWGSQHQNDGGYTNTCVFTVLDGTALVGYLGNRHDAVVLRCHFELRQRSQFRKSASKKKILHNVMYVARFFNNLASFGHSRVPNDRKSFICA